MSGQDKRSWIHRTNKLAVVRTTWWALNHTSRIVHGLLVMGIGLVLISGCLLAGTTWRLARGPIDLGWLSDRIQAVIADDTMPLHLSFNGVFLAWEGFDKGVDYPLDLRLSDLVVTDQSGRHVAEASAAHLTFSLAALLLGRIVPRAVEVDHAQVVVLRDAGGAINLGWEPAGAASSPFRSPPSVAQSSANPSGTVDLRQLREQLSRPVGSDRGANRGLLDQIQRVHFRDTDITFQDQVTGIAARMSGMGLDLVRARGGRIRGLLQAPLLIGAEQAELKAESDWVSGADTRLEMSLTPLRPAGLGAGIAALAGLDVPIALDASVALDQAFAPKQFEARMQIGRGQIHAGQGSLPLRSGNIVLSGTPDRVSVTTGHFDVAHTREGTPELVDISGTVVHALNRLTGSVTLGLSQIDIADLPLLWPAGIADGARAWVTGNVTGGIVTRGAGSFAIESDEALHGVVVTRAAGDIDVMNGAFTWMDHMPPVEQAAARLHLADPDTLEIHLTSGRQRVRNGAGDLLVKDGQMRIIGLSVPDQAAVIRAQVEGQIESVLALLKEPRLHLLSEHPVALKVGGGDVSAVLNFQFPLNSNLQIDDVQLGVDAHLKRVRLLDVVGGRELTDGVFDLGIDKEGLELKGQAALAAIPVLLEGTMDFRPGRPDQIVRNIVVTGEPDATQLDAAGLHVTDVLGGPIPMNATVVERRNGEGSVSLNGDLTPATISLAPLAWKKLPGTSAVASATLLMSHGRLTKVDRIAVRGDGILLTGSAILNDGHPQSLSLDTIRLGRTQGHGTVHFGTGEPIAIALQGDQIDLAPKLTEKPAGRDRPDAAPVTAPLWSVDARFAHAVLANDVRATSVLAKASGGGDQIRLVDVVGATSNNARFAIKIEPQAGGRHLLVDAKDAGSFLRGVDAVRTMQGGHLTIDGVFSQPAGLYPLAGSAVIDETVVKNSPGLGKLLQAITLYGLVDALRGPGMRFSHIMVPFHYTGRDLDLDQAYAQNPSLGLTAKGRIGLSGGETSLTGTIVPAYFFNAMLGNLPLVGKYFSPETGGGVFAVRFGVEGDIADPVITVNPVSALTPGFLRDIFNNTPGGGKDGAPAQGQ